MIANFLAPRLISTVSHQKMGENKQACHQGKTYVNRQEGYHAQESVHIDEYNVILSQE